MLNVEVILEDEDIGFQPLDEKDIVAFAREICARHGIDGGELNIVFSGDAFMAHLNETYKGREGTTDVLSFNLNEGSGDPFVGEVYVSLDKAREQAAEWGVPFDREVVRLIVHGLLHLAGRVHDTEEATVSMEAMTEQLTAEFFGEGAGR